MWFGEGMRGWDPGFEAQGKVQGDRSIFGFSAISLPCIHSPSSYIYLVLCPPKKWVTLEPQGSEGEGPCSHWSNWEKGDEQQQLQGQGWGGRGTWGGQRRGPTGRCQQGGRQRGGVLQSPDSL